MSLSVTAFADVIIEHFKEIDYKPLKLNIMIDEKVWTNIYGYVVRPLQITTIGVGKFITLKFSEIYEIFGNKCPYIKITENYKRRLLKEPMTIVINTEEKKTYKEHDYYEYSIEKIFSPVALKNYPLIRDAVNEKLKTIRDEKKDNGEIVIESYI